MASMALAFRRASTAAVTYPLWEQIRAHQTAFASMFAWGNAPIPRRPRQRGQASARTLGERRLLSRARHHARAGPAVHGRRRSPRMRRRSGDCESRVLADPSWRSRTAIGSTLTVLDQPFTVVGVTPAGFTGLEVGQSFDVALPVCSAALWGDSLDRRDLWWLTVMGRLKPDWTIPRANAHLRALSPGLLDATRSVGIWRRA